MQMLQESNEYEKVISFLMETTACSRLAARDWMLTENPFLGDISPLQMIAMNKAENVIRFIRADQEMAHDNT